MHAIIQRARRLATSPWVALVNWRQVAVLAILVAGSISMALLQQKEIALVFAGAAAGFATANDNRDRHGEHRRGDP